MFTYKCNCICTFARNKGKINVCYLVKCEFTLKRFCTVGNDKAIRVYCSDLQKTQKILQEQKIHTAAVNACTFVTHPELQIATASGMFLNLQLIGKIDDHTCCVISMNTKKVINSFRFESNVVAVHSNTQHNQEVISLPKCE